VATLQDWSIIFLRVIAVQTKEMTQLNAFFAKLTISVESRIREA
jgi:hypothetical protein